MPKKATLMTMRKNKDNSNEEMNREVPEPKERKKHIIEHVENFIDLNQSLIDEIENDDYSKYQLPLEDLRVFEKAKKNVDILDDMAFNCEKFDDFNKVIINLYLEASKSKLKIDQISSTRDSYKVSDEHDAYVLETLRYINEKIDNFKNKVAKLKRRKIRKEKKKWLKDREEKRKK